MIVIVNAYNEFLLNVKRFFEPIGFSNLPQFPIVVAGMDQGIVIASEIWYQLLLKAPFLGYLGAGTLAWRGSKRGQVLALLLTGASLFWHKAWTAALCLRLTPDIRSICKTMCTAWLRQAEDSHSVKVFDRFTQRTSRFLFEPNEELWQRFEKKEVRTILPDGTLETKSWFRRGKGLFTFTKAADLNRDRDVEAAAPYTFLRDDHSKAVVQVWTKTVDQSLKNAFDMEQIHEDKAADLLTGEELVAYNAFHRVLNNLLGDAVGHGKILKCTQRQETINDHISVEGKLQDVLKVLEAHPWTARHYFRCLVDRAGIQANLGFGKGNLPIYPGNLTTRVVMYIRQGTKNHACFQTFETFALDTRRPTSDKFSVVEGNFGRFLIADTLGRGAAGVVFKVRALDGSLDFAYSRFVDIFLYTVYCTCWFDAYIIISTCMIACIIDYSYTFCFTQKFFEFFHISLRFGR